MSQTSPLSILGDNQPRLKSGISGGPNTSKYVTLVPILPFYRIYFETLRLRSVMLTGARALTSITTATRRIPASRSKTRTRLI